MCFTSQPLSMNSTASQSSNSGFVGGSPCDPRSSRTLEIPVPKKSFHNRFTKTRAVSGFSRSTSQSARSRRFGRPPSSGICAKKLGACGSTISPESSIQFPRGSTRIVRGSMALVTSVSSAWSRIRFFSRSRSRMAFQWGLLAVRLANRRSITPRSSPCHESSRSSFDSGSSTGRSNESLPVTHKRWRYETPCRPKIWS